MHWHCGTPCGLVKIAASVQCNWLDASQDLSVLQYATISFEKEIEKQLPSENIVPVSLVWLEKQEVQKAHFKYSTPLDLHWVKHGIPRRYCDCQKEMVNFCDNCIMKSQLKGWRNLVICWFGAHLRHLYFFSFVQNACYFNRFNPILGKCYYNL